jgi:hypothetical protein
MDIRFLKGKSVSLTIVFNAEYNYANIQDVIVKLKDDTIAKKSDNTLLSTANPRVFRVQLTSEYTNALGSLSKLQVYLDDSSLGVFPFEEINVYADASLGFANTSINEGSDFTINLTVDLLNPSLDIETVEIYNTFSSQELALKANIASPTFTGKITTPDILVSNLTASQLVATDANDNLVSLATATYPSLTELSYVKGITSALQTQLGAKANLASPIFTGNLLLGSSTNSGEALQVTGTTKLAGNTAVTGTLTTSGTINGITVGRGGGGLISNTAVGDIALVLNTTGVNNTAIGGSALSNISGTNNNVAIGYYAGRLTSTGTANTSGVNSVFIGTASYPLGDAQTNQTVIGHDSRGLGSNTTVLGNSSTVTTGLWGDIRLVKGMATAPASATATGTVGDIRITSTAIYVCTATNTWKKSDLLTFI